MQYGSCPVGSALDKFVSKSQCPSVALVIHKGLRCSVLHQKRQIIIHPHGVLLKSSLTFVCALLQPGSDSGTTAVVALIRGKQLIVANAGDSRCVVSERGGPSMTAPAANL